jgi:hypothetical protein
MTQQDYEFRLTIGRDEVTGTWDGPNTTNAELGSQDIHRENHLETIQLLEAWLNRWDWIARRKGERLLVPDTFRVLGNHLWKMALSDVLGPPLNDAISNVQGSPLRPRPAVRIRMSFVDAPDLSALPWEFVHLEGDAPFFLAAETSLTLGRYLDGRARPETDFLSADNKLRVLFLVALPDWTEFDDERAEMQRLTNELSQHGETSERMQLVRYEGWNHEQVARKLREFRAGDDGGRVDVVHLMALFKRDDDHKIFLPDEFGKWEWTNADQVVDALTDDPDNRPSLVILHLCDWHEHDAANAPEHFEQLAPAFIRKEIPAVLAMQYPMRLREGRDFVPSLYRRLAAGMTIGAAVQACRSDQVKLRHRNRYFGTPVLYMQSKVDGRLVEKVVSGDDSETLGNRDRLPSTRKPTEGSSPASDLVFELTRVVDEMPGTKTTNEVIDWIQDETWPASVKDSTVRTEVQNRIRMYRRDHNDNQEVDDIMRLLLRKVAELASQGGGR